jgi:hypothetical protein
MLGLKSLFGKKGTELEAKLTPMNGGKGHGEFEYCALKDGKKELEIELHGLEGASADVRVNGQQRWTLSLAGGKCDAKFSSGKGDDVPLIAAGDRIEVVQGGKPVLGGVVRPD